MTKSTYEQEMENEEFRKEYEEHFKKVVTEEEYIKAFDEFMEKHKKTVEGLKNDTRT